MEEVEHLFRKLKRLKRIREKYRELREMLGVFKSFKLEKYWELCVYPQDADVGEEIRLLIELNIRAKIFKNIEEDVVIARVTLRVPKEKKGSFLWKLVPDDKPCKWGKWREFTALTPYEANKHSVGMGCEEYLYEEETFFPNREGEVMVLKPGQVWKAVFVFELRYTSPFNRPIRLCFFDDFGELIDSRVVFLEA